MALALRSEPLPLHVDDDGTVRVARTRVTLDTIIGAHLGGATPQEIAQDYPAVQLADIYAVLGYYLRNTVAIDQCLRERQEDAEKIRQKIEKRFDPVGIRQRLEKRRAERRGE